VVVLHHIPTFHTEHCVYAHVLSEGRDSKTCGLPCARHALSLVDPKGLAHPVITDVGCRNTVFEARAQSAASLVPSLIARGVRRFRVELVRETGDETRTVLDAYSALVAGRISPRACVERVGVHEQFGVVRGVARSMAETA
jgi:putative protease